MIRLRRTGDTPVQFEGEMVAKFLTWEHQTVRKQRHFMFYLFRTKCGSSVAEVSYDGLDDPKDPRVDRVFVAPSVETLREFLNSYDPLVGLIAASDELRPGPERQALSVEEGRELHADWDAAVEGLFRKEAMIRRLVEFIA